MVVPTTSVAVFELITHGLLSHSVPTWVNVVVAFAGLTPAAFIFSTFVFGTMNRLERELRDQNRRLAPLNAVAAHASESMELEEVASAITRDLAQAMTADCAGLALAGEDDGELRLVAQIGLPPTMTDAAGQLGPNDCGCRQVVTQGRTIVVEDSQESAACAGISPEGSAATCVSAPIRSKGKTIGAILVARSKSLPITADEVDLVTALGLQVGPVLQNAQLFSQTGALAVLQERQRMAREVHDGLAQTLGHLSLQVAITDRRLADGDADGARAQMEAMGQTVRGALADLRQSLVDLRVPLSACGDLRRTLREYVARFSLQTGIPCHFEDQRGPALALSPSAEVQLIRIVQEALTNVKKHAPGASVWLRMRSSGQQVHVTIQDDGPGFEPADVGDSGRFGLQTMKERAESAGGGFVVESRPGSGTRLEVTVPMEGVKVA